MNLKNQINIQKEIIANADNSQGQHGQKLLFNILKDIIQQNRDYGERLSATDGNIAKNIKNETVHSGNFANSFQHEVQQINEQKLTPTLLGNIISDEQSNITNSIINHTISG